MNISMEQSNLAKFLYALLLLFYHICIWGYNLSNRFFTFIMGVAMFGFLLLSGYGLTVSYYNNGLFNFWEKKFKKIYFPAVIINLFAVIELICMKKIDMNRGDAFKEVFLLNQSPLVNGELWFLRLLLVWYILFYMTYNYIRNTKIRIWAWGGVTLVMLYMIPETYGLANTYGLSFSVGVLLAELGRKGVDIEKIIKYIAIISCIGSYIFIYHSDNSGIICGTKINFFIYLIIINLILGCCAITLLILCEKMLETIIFFDKNAKILGGMSLMIYYLQRSCILNPMIWSTQIGFKIGWMLGGGTLVMIISYAYTKLNARFCK